MVDYKLSGFEYRDVELLESSFLRQRSDTVELYLRHPHMDDILHEDRVKAGIPSTANGMTGWGPSIGQYLGAFSKLYACTGDERLRERCMVLYRGWKACAQKAPSVYDRGTYMYDKFMGGLLDMYEYMGVAEALEDVCRLTEHAIANFDTSIPRDGVQDRRMKGQIEWYTLPENLLRAYQITGDSIYRDFASTWFYDYMWDKMRAGDFSIGPRHAYSHVNSLSSAARAYIVTEDPKYLEVITRGYQELLHKHTYITGGYGPAETLFGEGEGYLGHMLKSAHDFPDGISNVFKSFWGGSSVRSDTWGSCEVSCCAWAVFKLCNYLLKLTGDARYGVWAERMLVNGTLAQLPITKDGKVMYYANYFLNGGVKTVEDRRLTAGGGNNVWQCCTGTFPQDVAEYANMIYYQDAGGIYVSQYIPSKLHFQHEGDSFGISSTARFPEEEMLVLSIQAPRPAAFSVHIRVPSWADERAALYINGKQQSLTIEPDTWLTLDRRWEDGDEIRFAFPYRLRMVAVDDKNKDIAALAFGPLALVSEEMTILVGDRDRLDDWMKPVPGKYATFETLPGHAGKQAFVTRRFVPYLYVGAMTWYYMYFRVFPDLASVPDRPWN